MYLALEEGAEVWIQCLTRHFARKANPKAHVCTSEPCLRAFSGAVAIQLSELFNPLSLQKGEAGCWKWSLSAPVCTVLGTILEGAKRPLSPVAVQCYRQSSPSTWECPQQGFIS